MQKMLLKGMLALFVFASTSATAQEVKITPEMGTFSVTINGETIEISRIQDTSNRLVTDYNKTSRPCPPFCIHPISAAPNVETIGEIELMAFLEDHVEAGTGILVDSRTQDWYARGTIPGSVNIPNPVIEPSNPYRDEVLRALGGVETSSGWNYDNALELALFCNGPWCDQSPRAIQYLLTAGYPGEKMRYYRGGVQMWVLFGLPLSNTGS